MAILRKLGHRKWLLDMTVDKKRYRHTFKSKAIALQTYSELILMREYKTMDNAIEKARKRMGLTIDEDSLSDDLTIEEPDTPDEE